MSATFSGDMHANGRLNSVEVRYFIWKTTHFSEIGALENVPKHQRGWKLELGPNAFGSRQTTGTQVLLFAA